MGQLSRSGQLGDKPWRDRREARLERDADFVFGLRHSGPGDFWRDFIETAVYALLVILVKQPQAQPFGITFTGGKLS